MIIENRDLKKFKTVFVFEEYRDSAGHGSAICFDNSEDAIYYAINEWNHLAKTDKQSYLKDTYSYFTVTEKNIFLDEDGEYYPENEEINVFWDVFSYEKIGYLEEEIENKLNEIKDLTEDLTESIHDEFIPSKLRDCDQEDINTIKNYINQLNELKEEIKENQRTIANLEKDLIKQKKEAKKVSPKVDKQKVDEEMKKYMNFSKIYLSFEQMGQIRLGLEAGIDVSKYANPKLSDKQMEEIRWGLESGIDVSAYADPKFNDEQMEQIRLGLEAGIDVSKYADPYFNWIEMDIKRRDLKEEKLEAEKQVERKEAEIEI